MSSLLLFAIFGVCCLDARRRALSVFAEVAGLSSFHSERGRLNVYFRDYFAFALFLCLLFCCLRSIVRILSL